MRAHFGQSLTKQRFRLDSVRRVCACVCVTNTRDDKNAFYFAPDVYMIRIRFFCCSSTYIVASVAYDIHSKLLRTDGFGMIRPAGCVFVVRRRLRARIIFARFECIIARIQFRMLIGCSFLVRMSLSRRFLARCARSSEIECDFIVVVRPPPPLHHSLQNLR